MAKANSKAAPEQQLSSLLLDAADNVSYARDVTLKCLQRFVGQMIADGETTDEGETLILAIQLFATDAQQRLVAAERALDAARKVGSEVRHG